MSIHGNGIEFLSFDDVLIFPCYSDLESRSEANTCVLLKHLDFKHPIISANMETVTEDHMAYAMFCNGGLGIIHRYNTVNEQRELIKNMRDRMQYKYPEYIAAAVGTKDLEKRLDMLLYQGARIICLDLAHAHSKLAKEAIDFINLTRNRLNVILIAGNVSTYDGAKFLVDLGVDAVKVGTGPGSACSTRIITGVGVPQISAIELCYAATQGKVVLIADGGIKNSGDVAKAIAAGADMVMVGRLLAGCKESPGSIYEHADGSKYKLYRGMASKDAIVQCLGKDANDVVPEGVSMMVKYSGSVKDVITNLVGGLKSSMSYVGASNMQQFHENTQLLRITSSGLRESEPHGVYKNS